MAVRYTPDELKFLRDSPLVVKPPGLPPVEQWMQAPAENTRNVGGRGANDRNKNHETSGLIDPSLPRRPAHTSRHSAANPEDIILGPPKTSFMSATANRTSSKTYESSDRPPLRGTDSKDRFSFRGRGEGDEDRNRDSRGTLRPMKRNDVDQDSDGFTTVKPRKSFGTEGAERFNGRMGLDRNREDRRYRDRDDRDVKDKPRGFDTFLRDIKDNDHDADRESRRNGLGRGRNEGTWRDRENKDKDNDYPPTPRNRDSNGERYSDRNRGWREKDRDDTGDRGGRNDRGDRRWDNNRNQRDDRDRDPEWMDEPIEEKSHAHTQEDFQKWKEQMHLDKTGGSKPTPDDAHFKPDAGAGFFGLERPKAETPIETPLAIDTGPDKFFGMWASNEDKGPQTTVDPKEGVAKAKTLAGKSRFTSFFSPQEEAPRRQTEPPPPPPPSSAPPAQIGLGAGLGALFQNSGSSASNGPQQDEERQAFQQLLQKLQQQKAADNSASPPINIAQQPKPPQEKPQQQPVSSPDPFQQYRPDRHDENRSSTRHQNQQPNLQEILAQRQMTGSQPSMRPEQMLQDLVNARGNAISQSPARPEPQLNRNNNTEFLMGLMQSAKAAPEPQRTEQLLLRMPPKSAEHQMQQQMIEREQREMAREAAAQRERNAAQRRPAAPPGFFDDPAFQRGPPPERQGGGPPQPTQILQRPPPPGLDMGWERPQQHRVNPGLPPPPGLAGAPNRGMHMPPAQMFPPGFQPNNFPPPEAMAGRGMVPPPGFYQPTGPHPGFFPPGMMPGPEALGGFGGPYDGRGPPPQGAFRRQ